MTVQLAKPDDGVRPSSGEPAAPRGRAPAARLEDGKACPEAAFLLAALRASLLGGADTRLDANTVDWDALAGVARDNRLLIPAATGIGVLGIVAPQHFVTAADRYRALTFSINSANMMTVAGLAREIRKAELEAVIFKGPFAQQALHGDYFSRPSMDIDILVRPRDMEAARALLDSIGYALSPDCNSYWWRRFLGEQHFIRDGAPSIDLHHRVQQPGCPSPLRIGDFLAASEPAAAGDTLVPRLSWLYACLLSCMSLAKDVVHGEASGGHLYDIARHVVQRSKADMDALRTVALGLGLGGTLDMALASIHELLGLKARGWEPGAGAPMVPRNMLADAILRPAIVRDSLPRRRSMLLRLSDSVPDFLRESAWMYAAEIVRRSSGRVSSRAGDNC